MEQRVGIVLVNFNGYKDTVECVLSIKKSSYKNYEIIIVDNNSSSDREKLLEIEGVFVKLLDDNVGFGIANNIGAEIAANNGDDYILCLNNDTVVTEDFLHNIMKYANEKSILSSKINYYDKKEMTWYGGGKTSKILGNFRHKNYSSTREVTFLCGCCLLLPTKCYKKIGLFDDRYFMYYEDSDFSLKARMHGYNLVYVYEALIYHKVGRSSDKVNGLLDYYTTRNRLYILNKYKKYFKLSAHIYFMITRFVVIVKYILKGEDYSYILNGMQDYTYGKMGKKDL